MKISYSLYMLAGKKLIGQRKGALLRFEFAGGNVGYADCHPWVELGDVSLKQQLSLLLQGILTPLTRRSLFFAKLDAKARVEKKNVFEGISLPSSHWLLSHPKEEIPEGFSRVKLKVGRDPAQEIPSLLTLFRRLSDEIKVRLDFNAKLSQKEFDAYLERIKKWIHRIEFIEDPYPYEAQSWEATQNTYGILLACDAQSEKRQYQKRSHGVSVVKPAIQEETSFLSKLKLVVTSYLDHPLGQLGAAYIAGKLAKTSSSKLLACGLLSHVVYEPNAFSEQLCLRGTILIPPVEGMGFGFDQLLEKQPWKPIGCN